MQSKITTKHTNHTKTEAMDANRILFTEWLYGSVLLRWMAPFVCFVVYFS